jgi:Rab family protein
MVGESDVGKTFLCSQYIKSELPENPAHTIGVEFSTKIVPTKSGGSVKLQLWDTAGEERYRGITKSHYRKALGALIVFDLTQEVTFQRVPQWAADICETIPDAVLMLVGNKRDLVQENPSLRAVTFENAQALASSNGMLYMEVSAVSRAGVNEAFEVFLDAIHQKASETSSAPS